MIPEKIRPAVLTNIGPNSLGSGDSILPLESRKDRHFETPCCCERAAVNLLAIKEK